MQGLRLTALENEWITPFNTIDKSLEKCAFRLSKNDNWQVETNFYSEKEEKLDPEILLDFDFSNTEYAHDNLLISVLVRDKHLLKSYLAYKQNSSESQNCVVDLSEYFATDASSAKYDIDVLVSKAEPENKSNPFPKLALKRFIVDQLSQTSEFPKEWREPEDFVQQGLPADTVWFLNWRAMDIDLPIESMVSLWINTNYQSSFLALAADKNQEPFKRSFLADILAQIMIFVFGQAVEQDNFQFRAPSTMLRRLDQNLNIKEEDVRLAVRKKDFHAIAHAWSISLVKLHEGFINHYGK